MKTRAKVDDDFMKVVVILSIISLIDEILVFFIFLFFVSTSVQLFEMTRCVSFIFFSIMIIERFVFDFFTMYNLARSTRVLFVFLFFLMRILQFEIQITCLFFSHVAHFLCCSMMIESQSTIQCLFAHVSHTMTILHHFSI